MFEKLRLLVPQPRPLAEYLRKRRLAVERVDPAEDLLVADLLRLGNVDEDVEMVRHDRIRENDDAAEILDPAQKLNRPRLLVVIKKKRLMCQPADQVIAAAILYKPRLSHVEKCITKLITMSMLLHQ